MWIRTSRSTCADVLSLLFLLENGDVGEVGEGGEGCEGGPSSTVVGGPMLVANAAAIDADRDHGRWAAVDSLAPNSEQYGK